MAHETTIGETIYSVIEHDAMRMMRLQKPLAPVFVELAGAFAKTVQQVAKGYLAETAAGDEEKEIGLHVEDLLSINVDAVTPSLVRAFQNLSADDLEHITRQLLAGSMMQVEGKWIQLLGADGTGGAFNLKMKRRISHVWRLLIFALEVNYPDFFDVLGELGAQLRAASARARSSTSPTSGPSTA
jgi:hypothetical protein